MTIREFRAWLDGFKEAIGEAPTPEQWAKVLQKVSEVREPLPVLPNTQPNILGPYWSPTTVWCGPVTSKTSGSITSPHDPNIRPFN